LIYPIINRLLQNDIVKEAEVSSHIIHSITDWSFSCNLKLIQIFLSKYPIILYSNLSIFKFNSIHLNGTNCQNGF